MEPEVGARIRRIREAAGLRAQDLAARVDLDPTAISKIENGRRAIKTAELTRIADALKVSPLALLEDDTLLTDLPIAARRAGTSIAQGGAYERLLSLSELHVVLADAGIPTTPNLAAVPRTTGMGWFEAANRLADWALQRLNFQVVEGDQRLAALADAIERELDVDVFIKAYPGDPLSGAAITHPAFPLIFVNSDHPRSRSLFTLAHELGHILAGHAEDSITLDRELAGSTDAERMANAFAANLLMPEPEIRAAIEGNGRKMSTLVRLVNTLGVSYESLVYRLHNLRLINADGRDKLRAISWQQLSAHLSEPSLSSGLPREQIGRLQYRGTAKPAGRPPALLLRRAAEGYQKGVISIRPLAALKDVDPDTLLDALEAIADFDAAVHEVDNAHFGDVDTTETQDELFAGSPV